MSWRTDMKPQRPYSAVSDDGSEQESRVDPPRLATVA